MARLRAALLALALLASCATTHPSEPRPASGHLKVGIAFLTVGAVSMAVGGGLFGYALAHKPANMDSPEFALFVPGVFFFGIGIPFVATGTVFTISGALAKP